MIESTLDLEVLGFNETSDRGVGLKSSSPVIESTSNLEVVGLNETSDRRVEESGIMIEGAPDLGVVGVDGSPVLCCSASTNHL